MFCAEHFLWLRMLMKFVSACWAISGELTSTEISPALCGSTFAASHARLSICGLLSGKSYCFLRCRVLHTPACFQGSPTKPTAENVEGDLWLAALECGVQVGFPVVCLPARPRPRQI